ncbi:MAG: glucose 1-dehydrogenase [Candidatus Latescibacterota bacterium]|jgi:NAD(P)-dependent dehydrogenase (short-subunit alcohol dehydrogenase family)
MPLTGKIAVVSGAASGIGAAIAKQFADAGAFVYLTDIDADTGRKTTAQIDPTESNVAFVELDVSDPAACDAFAERVLSEKSRLDILVNNAGIGHVGTILQTTAEDLDRLYAVNVRGVFNLSKSFTPAMIEAGTGSIINMASVAGVVGLRDRLAYASTKWAVVGLTKSMALDHATTGVRINCICPARVETPFVKARISEYPDPEAAYEEMSMSQPVGRMAKPEEIADAALYLARDESSFVTGSAFLIDGAFSAGK